MNDNLKVFSSGANNPLAREICNHLGISLSQIEISRFSNDNLFVQVQTLKKAGVRKVYVGATHPVLCGNAVTSLKTSTITEIVVTNTVHIPKDKQFSKLKVLSMGSLFSKAILRIHTGESVSALFK